MTAAEAENGYRSVRLKSGHDRRVRRGHPWIFSNELEDGPAGYAVGELVQVHSGKGQFLGIGYINPHSLIAVRLLRRDPGPIDTAFLDARLERAIVLRDRLYPAADAVRLVNSEGDGLPGLILDRYGPALVLQVTTAGMQALLPLLIPRLESRLEPACIVARNDLPVRRLEGLTEEIAVLAGEPDPDLEVTYEGLRLAVDLTGGQKTGLYLDQRDNQRHFLTPPLGDVLDCYCYQGTWALLALRAGADRAVGLDTSAEGIAAAARHADRNGLADRVDFERRDTIEALKAFRSAGRSFDTVILDPPAFVKNRKHLRAGLRGYLDLNRKGFDILRSGGTLITCSCSHHVSPETFTDTVSHAASLAGRHVRITGRGAQSADHAPLLTAPETAYLKCLALQVE